MKVVVLQAEEGCIRYSFIIPVKEINDYIFETVPYIQAIKRDDWELLIVPDSLSENIWSDDRIHLIESGVKKGPAYKRDYGAEVARGEVLVFLDDDSYPNSDLLDIADRYFRDSKTIALGGPGITPVSDSFWQKVSGAVFLSRLSGGVPERYLSIGTARKVVDWPSVNLMVRKFAFKKVNGFNSEYWPGEDSLFCQKLVNSKLGHILYIPEMVVWHHRREGLLRHLKQVGAYALHRGYFAKRFGGNSLRLVYFIPTCFVIFCFTTLVTFLMPIDLDVIYFLWAIYVSAIVKALFDISKYHKMSIAFATIPYIILTHIFYGIKFMQGIATNKLTSKLR